MRFAHIRRALFISAALTGLAALAALPAGPAAAQQPGAQQAGATAVAIDNDDIGGVVRGPNGPEAGVWVIAETHDLGVRYIKIVVTDDQGRYVDRKSTRLNSSHLGISYAVFCLKKKKKTQTNTQRQIKSDK